MVRRKKKKGHRADQTRASAPDASADKKKPAPDSPDSEQDAASGWSEEQRRPRWKDFPGPKGADEPIRVVFSREAYAEVTSHAKENLDAEVCGVLAGEFCEDREGEYVSVLAAVRGTSTKQGSAHVTYTQETWNEIHESMERDHPRFRIVGWYHTHPGFGVEFSDMDLFIQENFFSARGQIAMVADPLGGQEAMCVKGPEGIEHISRFWVEGRQRRCHVPSASSTDAAGAAAADDKLTKALRSVEDRLDQTLRSLESLRTAYSRFLLTVGMIIAVGVVFWIGKSIYDHYTRLARPPEMQAFSSGPVKIGNEWRWVGASLVSKRLPPELEAQLIEAEIRQFEAAQAERKKKQAEQDKASQKQPTGAAGGGRPASSTTTESGKP